MPCAKCGHSKCTLVKTPKFDGSFQVWLKCDKCNKNFRGSAQFLKQAGLDMDKIPVYDPNPAKREKCVVRGCNNYDVQYHHFAPRHLFQMDADDWPVLPVCNFHHSLWHALVTPGMCDTDRLKRAA